MAVFKCKICGGTLEINAGETVATCEYCGTKQTLPKLDDEKKANLFDRANHFRRNNDFDKAMGIYEQILNEDTEDAESYWSIVLCRYGIEYVEDPSSRKRVPTVNRAQFTSVFDDEDYKSAIKYADSYQKNIYEAEAAAINEIQKGILAISQKEEPFDVFICYKETDNNGRRTQDSVLATELYHELTKEGFKVFFSRITLEDKLGVAYEPYIFAALHSAKVMVALGTKPEHFNAVWVKNEWSRYLSLIKNGANKILIPAYRDMDPYDLPEEFSHLQAQDMSKLGFMQDLVRGIKKIVSADSSSGVKETVVVQSAASGNSSALVKRGFLALEDGEWEKADEFFEQALNHNAEDAQAYLGKLMAELKISKEEELKNCNEPIEEMSNYQKIIRFADDNLKKKLEGYMLSIVERNELARAKKVYASAMQKMKTATTSERYLEAADEFSSIPDFKDANKLSDECREKAGNVYKDEILKNAASLLNDTHYWAGKDTDIHSYEEAAKELETIIGYKDAEEKLYECRAKIEQVRVRIEEVKIQQERENIEKEKREKENKQRKEKLQKIKKYVIIACALIITMVIALIVLFSKIIIPKNKYNEALEYYNNGEYSQAVPLFSEIYKYEKFADAKKYLFEISNMSDKHISAYNNQLVVKNSDGTIKYFTNMHDIRLCALTQLDWSDIKELSVGDGFVVGLKQDGSVIMYGENEYISELVLDDWKDIIQIDAGCAHVVGLKADGTVVSEGWQQVGQCRTLEWTDIVDISAGEHHTVGLKKDGTVVAVGWNRDNQCNVDGWTDIVSVSAGNTHTVGLKKDGTVVAVGNNGSGQCDVETFKNVKHISAGGILTLATTYDGDMYFAGGPETFVNFYYNYSNAQENGNLVEHSDILNIALAEQYVGVQYDGRFYQGTASGLHKYDFSDENIYLDKINQTHEVK